MTGWLGELVCAHGGPRHWEEGRNLHARHEDVYLQVAQHSCSAPPRQLTATQRLPGTVNRFPPPLPSPHLVHDGKQDPELQQRPCVQLHAVLRRPAPEARGGVRARRGGGARAVPSVQAGALQPLQVLQQGPHVWGKVAARLTLTQQL